MNADNTMLLKDIIGGGKKQYQIPVYQRNYTWTKKECSTLYEDIKKINEANGRKTHFLGAIVFIRDSVTSLFGFERYYLIDGQQRLTTTMLLLRAVHDVMKEEYGDNNDVVVEINENLLTNARMTDANFKLKLKPNAKDDQVFEQIMKSDFYNIDKSNNLYKNYIFFKNEFSKEENPMEFFQKMYKLSIVYIDLNESEDNPQLIFESLNSKNKKLHEADLIRNFILMDKSPSVQESLFEEYWKEIERNVGEENLTNFIRDYLMMELASVVSKTDVYNTFKSFVFNTTNYNTEDLLADLRRYSIPYSILLGKTKHSEGVVLNAIESLNGMQISQTFPFLLYAMEENLKGNLLSDDLVNVLKLMESYLFRRTVVGVVSGSLSHKMAKLPRVLKRHRDLRTHFYKYFAGLMIADKSQAYFPKNEDFKSFLMTRDMYKFKTSKYMYTMLENKLNPKEKIEFESDFQIEHIMPQTLTGDWKNDLGNEHVDIHEKYLNNLGNLTITKYNPEMKNLSYSAKKKHIDISRINLNHMLSSFDRFTEEEIKIRREYLTDLSLTIWEYPKVPQKYCIAEPLMNTYSVCDDVMVIDESPTKVIYKGTSKKVSSWNQLYELVLRNLSNEYSETFTSGEFINLIEEKGLGVSVLDFDQITDFIQIDDLFFNINKPVEVKINTLRWLLELNELNSDEIKYVIG